MIQYILHSICIIYHVLRVKCIIYHIVHIVHCITYVNHYVIHLIHYIGWTAAGGWDNTPPPPPKTPGPGDMQGIRISCWGGCAPPDPPLALRCFHIPSPLTWNFEIWQYLRCRKTRNVQTFQNLEVEIQHFKIFRILVWWIIIFIFFSKLSSHIPKFSKKKYKIFKISQCFQPGYGTR